MKKTKKTSVQKAEKHLTPSDILTKNAAAEEALSALFAPPKTDETQKKEEKPTEAETKEAVKKEDNALLHELLLLKDILQRLMDDLGAPDLATLREQIDRAEIEKLMAGHALSEEAAKLFLSQQEKLRATRVAQHEMERRAEMEALKKEPLYADIDDYKDILDAFCFRTGLTAREGYNALFAEEKLRALLKKMQENETENEKKAKNIPALSGGGAPDKGAHVRLNELEVWAAANAGMTPAEYAKYKYNNA